MAGTTEASTPRTWGLDSDMSPSDFLIGHLTGRWVGEEDSLEDASVALLAATFVEAGLETEAAIDKAYDYLERGATLKWDGNGSLSFEFAKTPTSTSTG